MHYFVLKICFVYKTIGRISISKTNLIKDPVFPPEADKFLIWSQPYFNVFLSCKCLHLNSGPFLVMDQSNVENICVVKIKLFSLLFTLPIENLSRHGQGGGQKQKGKTPSLHNQSVYCSLKL